MKRLFIGITLTVCIFSAIPDGAVRAEETTASSVGNSALPLCLPGIYLSQQQDCLALGPSQTLSGLAKIGYTFPPKPPVGFNPFRGSGNHSLSLY